MKTSFLEYIRFQKRLIALYLIIMSFITITLYVEPTMSIHFNNLIYIHIVTSCFLIAYLAFDYYIILKQYKSLTSRWSKGLFIREGVEDAKTYEQQLYLDFFQSIYDEHQQQLTTTRQDKKESLEFMTMWVHEIKTPIAISKLLLEQAEGDLDFLSLKEEINRIERSVEQALYFTRTDNFAQDYLITKTELDKLVRSLIKHHAKEFIQLKIKMVLQVKQAVVNTDPKWLSFALSEFISNALKYAGNEGTIEIRSENDGEETRLIIQDDGIGIPQHDISRIFQLGFTGTNGRISRKSTGMGLYIAKKIINKLGHGISVSSKEGEYTRITIHFPKGDDYYSTVI
ncbi:HAMP domain-containing sensor histidine kinase [Sporosarcina sp. Te-1]|uniref:sensor histidine kinase n=1 Tax=Sporosarcina sp. Te-1 TaxID=2818390 RepID=UPI001A9F4BB3|nr:sensor histidine kinase [Sporosarcina sp. Te-1]QTD40495.1 sensor histidine kinase [Sporosarcina sp. Te-1]